VHLGLLEKRLADLQGSVALELAGLEHLGALGVDGAIGLETLAHKHGLAIVELAVIRLDDAVGSKATNMLHLRTRLAAAVRGGLACLVDLGLVGVHLALGVGRAGHERRLTAGGALLEHFRRELHGTVRLEGALAVHTGGG